MPEIKDQFRIRSDFDPESPGNQTRRYDIPNRTEGDLYETFALTTQRPVEPEGWLPEEPVASPPPPSAQLAPLGDEEEDLTPTQVLSRPQAAQQVTSPAATEALEEPWFQSEPTEHQEQGRVAIPPPKPSAPQQRFQTVMAACLAVLVVAAAVALATAWQRGLIGVQTIAAASAPVSVKINPEAQGPCLTIRPVVQAETLVHSAPQVVEPEPGHKKSSRRPCPHNNSCPCKQPGGRCVSRQRKPPTVT